ncbi:MAG: hypothetical protein RR540_08255, partial [Oscillospiraceae bacterium]
PAVENGNSALGGETAFRRRRTHRAGMLENLPPQKPPPNGKKSYNKVYKKFTFKPKLFQFYADI